MNSREMFEKLGFKYEETSDTIEYRTINSGYIEFFLHQKFYYVSDRAIDVVLHKAITKQLEELRWLDE